MEDSKRHGGTKCAVTGCDYNSGEKTFSLFTLPKQRERLNEWLKAIGRTDLLEKGLKGLFLKGLNNRICGKHFEQKMFLNDLQNRLHTHAVPTLSLPNADTMTKSSKPKPDSPVKMNVQISPRVVLERLPPSAIPSTFQPKSPLEQESKIKYQMCNRDVVIVIEPPGYYDLATNSRKIEDSLQKNTDEFEDRKLSSISTEKLQQTGTNVAGFEDRSSVTTDANEETKIDQSQHKSPVSTDVRQRTRTKSGQFQDAVLKNTHEEYHQMKIDQFEDRSSRSMNGRKRVQTKSGQFKVAVSKNTNDLQTKNDSFEDKSVLTKSDRTTCGQFQDPLLKNTVEECLQTKSDQFQTSPVSTNRKRSRTRSGQFRDTVSKNNEEYLLAKNDSFEDCNSVSTDSDRKTPLKKSGQFEDLVPKNMNEECLQIKMDHFENKSPVSKDTKKRYQKKSGQFHDAVSKNTDEESPQTKTNQFQNNSVSTDNDRKRRRTKSSQFQDEISKNTHEAMTTHQFEYNSISTNNDRKRRRTKSCQVQDAVSKNTNEECLITKNTNEECLQLKIYQFESSPEPMGSDKKRVQKKSGQFQDAASKIIDEECLQMKDKFGNSSASMESVSKIIRKKSGQFHDALSTTTNEEYVQMTNTNEEYLQTKINQFENSLESTNGDKQTPRRKSGQFQEAVSKNINEECIQTKNTNQECLLTKIDQFEERKSSSMDSNRKRPRTRSGQFIDESSTSKNEESLQLNVNVDQFENKAMDNKRSRRTNYRKKIPTKKIIGQFEDANPMLENTNEERLQMQTEQLENETSLSTDTNKTGQMEKKIDEFEDVILMSKNSNEERLQMKTGQLENETTLSTDNSKMLQTKKKIGQFEDVMMSKNSNEERLQTKTAQIENKTISAHNVFQTKKIDQFEDRRPSSIEEERLQTETEIAAFLKGRSQSMNDKGWLQMSTNGQFKDISSVSIANEAKLQEKSIKIEDSSPSTSTLTPEKKMIGQIEDRTLVPTNIKEEYYKVQKKTQIQDSSTANMSQLKDGTSAVHINEDKSQMETNLDQLQYLQEDSVSTKRKRRSSKTKKDKIKDRFRTTHKNEIIRIVTNVDDFEKFEQIVRTKIHSEQLDTKNEPPLKTTIDKFQENSTFTNDPEVHLRNIEVVRKKRRYTKRKNNKEDKTMTKTEKSGRVKRNNKEIPQTMRKIAQFEEKSSVTNINEETLQINTNGEKLNDSRVFGKTGRLIKKKKMDKFEESSPKSKNKKFEVIKMNTFKNGDLVVNNEASLQMKTSAVSKNVSEARLQIKRLNVGKFGVKTLVFPNKNKERVQMMTVKQFEDRTPVLTNVNKEKPQSKTSVGKVEVKPLVSPYKNKERDNQTVKQFEDRSSGLINVTEKSAQLKINIGKFKGKTLVSPNKNTEEVQLKTVKQFEDGTSRLINANKERTQLKTNVSKSEVKSLISASKIKENVQMKTKKQFEDKTSGLMNVNEERTQLKTSVGKFEVEKLVSPNKNKEKVQLKTVKQFEDGTCRLTNTNKERTQLKTNVSKSEVKTLVSASKNKEKVQMETVKQFKDRSSELTNATEERLQWNPNVGKLEIKTLVTANTNIEKVEMKIVKRFEDGTSGLTNVKQERPESEVETSLSTNQTKERLEMKEVDQFKDRTSGLTVDEERPHLNTNVGKFVVLSSKNKEILQMKTVPQFKDAIVNEERSQLKTNVGKLEGITLVPINNKERLQMKTMPQFKDTTVNEERSQLKTTVSKLEGITLTPINNKEKLQMKTENQFEDKTRLRIVNKVRPLLKTNLGTFEIISTISSKERLQLKTLDQFEDATELKPEERQLKTSGGKFLIKAFVPLNKSKERAKTEFEERTSGLIFNKERPQVKMEGKSDVSLVSANNKERLQMKTIDQFEERILVSNEGLKIGRVDEYVVLEECPILQNLLLKDPRLARNKVLEVKNDKRAMVKECQSDRIEDIASGSIADSRLARNKNVSIAVNKEATGKKCQNDRIEDIGSRSIQERLRKIDDRLEAIVAEVRNECNRSVEGNQADNYEKVDGMRKVIKKSLNGDFCTFVVSHLEKCNPKTRRRVENEIIKLFVEIDEGH